MRASSVLVYTLLGCFVVLMYRSLTSHSQHDIDSLETSLRNHVKYNNKIQTELHKLQSSHDVCQDQLAHLHDQIGTLKQKSTGWAAADGGDQTMINQVPASVSASDSALLSALYGNDADEVPVQVSLGDGKRITMLIDIKRMPHTSRYFLDLVSRGWWNGCHVIRNAPHVIQFDCGVPHPNNYPRIAYQEYNPLKSHVAYTIGLAGRPGGPDFYISIVDNTVGHGPGGQSGGNDQVADPCFGRILEESIPTVKALKEGMGEKGEGDNKFLKREDFIEVREMKITQE